MTISLDTIAKDITERASIYCTTRHRAYAELLDDLFTPYAWPGGYQIIFVTSDGSVLCHECAREEWRYNKSDISSDIYYEGPVMYCDDCNCEIASAYGDPDEQETNQ